MRLLKEVAKQFGVSRAVFECSFSNDEDATSLEFSLKESYKPHVSHFDDPVAKLLATKYSETYDKTLRKFVHSFSYEQIYKEIMKTITLFYVEHTDLKNPKQSRLYKWLDLSYTNEMKHPAAEGFIALYRYIYNYGEACNNSMTVENVLAILELMKEKYEVKQEAD